VREEGRIFQSLSKTFRLSLKLVIFISQPVFSYLFRYSASLWIADFYEDRLFLYLKKSQSTSASWQPKQCSCCFGYIVPPTTLAPTPAQRCSFPLQGYRSQNIVFLSRSLAVSSLHLSSLDRSTSVHTEVTDAAPSTSSSAPRPLTEVSPCPPSGTAPNSQYYRYKN